MVQTALILVSTLWTTRINNLAVGTEVLGLVGLTVLLVLLWLVFEMSIFRDASFKIPWLYVLLMLAIGLLYFLFLVLARPDALKSLPVEREGAAMPPEGQSD